MLITVFAALLALAHEPRALAAQTPAPVATQAVEVDALSRVAIIGASVSNGFRAPPGWQAAFVASLSRSSECIANEATSMVFMDPVRHSTPQVARALTAKPTLVLAVDFLFWFGYGTHDAAGRKLESEEARLTLLDKGLELLDKFDCPLVVGDFPDMSSAVGRSLMPGQVPQTETLKKLNARIAEWVGNNPNVVLVPMAKWIDDLHAHKTLKLGDKSYAPEVTARWIQPDGLHPTAEGLAALATLVDAHLEQRKLVAKTDYIADAAKVLERMQVKPAGADAPSGGK